MENNEGKGVLIHSDANKLKFKVKCTCDGKLNLILKGLFFNDASSKRIPIYVDITKLVINEEILIDSSNLVYHDRALTYVKNVEDGEIVDVEVEWEPLNKESRLITNTVLKHPNVIEEEKNIVKEKSASITLQNIGNSYNGIVVLDSPEEAIVSKPHHLQESDGTEINITSRKNEIMLSLMFIEDGEFIFKLNDILNNEIWDEKSSYKTLIINDEIVFTSDDSLDDYGEYEYKKEIKNAEKMDIMVEWS